MKSAEKLQDVINELQGKIPALHLHSIAMRIAAAEEKAESLECALIQVKQPQDEERAVRQYHLYLVNALIDGGIVTNPAQISSLQNLVNQYLTEQQPGKNC